MSRTDKIVCFGRNGEVSHLCLVEKKIPGGFEFYVINGAWNGSWVDGTLTCYHPTDRSTHPATIVYSGVFPANRTYAKYDSFYSRRQYEDTIAIINDRLKSWIPNKMFVLHDLACTWFGFTDTRLYHSLKAAKRAFKIVWKGPVPALGEEFNDDIPF